MVLASRLLPDRARRRAPVPPGQGPLGADRAVLRRRIRAGTRPGAGQLGVAGVCTRLSPGCGQRLGIAGQRRYGVVDERCMAGGWTDGVHRMSEVSVGSPSDLQVVPVQQRPGEQLRTGGQRYRANAVRSTNTSTLPPTVTA